ncbi:U11/U12 small nuclear ribonucleoprotein 59 kDa protein, partial [Phalaenopsis equestris]|uniref:U11/U12 small nuclear ribonucleoprotein 59 kDa protein n=1 Tax=Phalaenopsis equestris TaxID=78828 RepID=UPI0009E5CB56
YFPTQLVSGGPSSLQTVQAIQHASNTFWRADQVHEHLRNLQETLHLLKSVQKELEGIYLIKRSNCTGEADGFPFNQLKGKNLLSSPFDSFGNEMFSELAEIITEKKICPEVQESLALEAANSLMATLKSQLAPFNAISSETSQWEDKSMAIWLAQKQQKYKRNKHWKKRKRKQVAELLRKEYDGYDKVDEEADEWRAREIAKDIAKRKIENMKSIAKLKAIEERKRLESELELVLVVEKLQELRSIRIDKLKKQGHFLPEEDDKFLERVRSAVEEEERQAAAAADTHAARDAISTAEESRKTIRITNPDASVVKQNRVGSPVKQVQVSTAEIERSSTVNATQGSEQKVEGQGFNNAYESVTNLPIEFYQYYHGSNNDMGKLIEVRSIWDAYIKPGGSRIPGHWVQPPPPADEVWASYLVSTMNR